MSIFDKIIHAERTDGMKEPEGSHMEFSQEAKKVAAEEILKAIHSADAKALAEALHSFSESVWNELESGEMEEEVY